MVVVVVQEGVEVMQGVQESTQAHRFCCCPAGPCEAAAAAALAAAWLPCSRPGTAPRRCESCAPPGQGLPLRSLQARVKIPLQQHQQTQQQQKRHTAAAGSADAAAPLLLLEKKDDKTRRRSRH